MLSSIENLMRRFGFSSRSGVGLAMSGGGAKGFSHIGVLMAFEAFGMRPDIISGVSAGSIAAALYGAGLSPEDILECFASSSKFGDYTEWTIPRQGFLRLDRFGRLLDSWLPVKRLEEMKIPTVICATDFDHGKSVGWAKGEIVPRVLASCSIPVVFPPMVINGVHYVDGGVLRNLPAWAIRRYCGTLYGSNCSPLQQRYEYKDSIQNIMMRAYHLMSKANTLQDINLCDHIIAHREVTHVGTFELKALKETVTKGYDTACRVLEKQLNK